LHYSFSLAAIFIPPKQEQTLLQGGTFVFDGEKTLYAHYDPSTAAHAPVDRVMNVVNEKFNRQRA